MKTLLYLTGVYFSRTISYKPYQPLTLSVIYIHRYHLTYNYTNHRKDTTMHPVSFVSLSMESPSSLSENNPTNPVS